MNSASAHKQAEGKPRLVLVDGSGYIFRAYHAIRPMSRPDGTPIHAVFGFTNMLLKLRETYANDYLTVIFDASRRSFRMDLYKEYKAHRPPAPDDLIPQFPLTRAAVKALSVPCIEMDNYEADDLIASYAEAAAAKGLDVVIVSSDKDLMQLIRDGVTMYDPMKDKPIGEAEVMEKFGVGPDKVVEVQALIGDSTDNVPGVPGIGPKTAAELIGQFGSLDNLLAHLAEIKQPKRRETLEQHADDARLSRQLVALKRDIPLPQQIESFDLEPYDKDKLFAFLTEQHFTSILKRLGASSAAAPFSSSAAPAKAQEAAPVARPQVDAHYETVTSEAALKKWIDEALAGGVVAVDTETTSLNAVDAELVGVSLSTAAGHACYIPLGHVTSIAVAQGNMFDEGPPKLVPGQLPRDKALALLKPMFTHPGVLKVGHNLKYDLVVLEKYGVTMTPIGDTMLMSYCVAGGLHAHGLDFLAERYCNHKMISFTDVVGTGKAQKNFSEIGLEQATAYAAEDADFTLRLYEILRQEVVDQHVATVYETIERPLIPVIVAMETAGVLIDTKMLGGLSHEFAVKIAAVEKEIIAMAGMEFSVGSPKQLGDVLFGKLQLPGGKKSSKTGAYTTDAGTLEDLAADGHEIAAKVLEWRQFSKLKSTYTDALPNATSPRDGRVHTSFSMATAATGRLASSDPNLQNIPIRTEEGRRIRDAFVAPKGCKLISADYSQIELRLLAHVAGIESLKQAFLGGADIHAVTAHQIFGVPLDKVTPELRRSAKTINFGIIYGMSAHGLAMRLGIPRTEAADYIDKYFKQYPGIREYMDDTIGFARANGYVQTLFGRKIHVKDINNKNGQLRNFSERAAINAPLQGSAADIIKRAMVVVHDMLQKEKGARILLQVHDELLVETPAETAESLAQRVKRAMEQAVAFPIPFTVEVGVGNHWGEIH